MSGAGHFLGGLRAAAENGTRIYGECGGYMVLGETITDAEGRPHKMVGLLALETSFAKRKLHLGYRRMTPLAEVWPGLEPVTGHEFHYTTATRADGDPMFAVSDAAGRELGTTGLVRGRVAGSYAHIIA